MAPAIVRVAEGLRRMMRSPATLSMRNVWPTELDLMAKNGVWFITRSQTGFPERLLNIPDPPHILYGRGELKPTDANAVALVGSRFE